MNSWFHYAKLYAATAGCIGFMMLKYKWGIGKKNWFKVFPFAIVAINILIAVGSDFESAIKGGISGGWWLSSENVWLYGGWWNWVNGIAGIINIFCMTGWWGIYSSKNKQDMLWPDMTWRYILAYDLWNFEYTYNNLPTHSWYCGLALLLAPTFANAFWNKGGWIQNRANKSNNGNYALHFRVCVCWRNCRVHISVCINGCKNREAAFVLEKRKYLSKHTPKCKCVSY